MVRIYTKTGDTGTTSLYGGKRVPKGHLRIETVGTLDETNAAIGLALTDLADKDLCRPLRFVQDALFEIGAETARDGRPEKTGGTGKAAASGRDESSRVTPLQVAKLEQWIDRFDRDLPRLTEFILPGGSAVGARLHLARTVCRRAERRLVRLGEEAAINPASLMFLNRLSDLLFVLARTVNRRAGVPEHPWRKSK